MDLDPIERTISGKGQIRIPSDYNSALQIYLYADLIRNSSNPSINKTWNPDKGFYAHITFCFEDYVLYAFDMNFKKQMWQILTNQSAQNLLSLICAYDGILDSFVEIGNAVGFVISRTNLIKEHPYLKFVPNSIKFECFGEVAIRLTLKGTALDKCNDEDGQPTPPPEPPPPPPPEVPPTTPVIVSEPYDLTGGDPDTVPNPIDGFNDLPDLPFGVSCQVYAVRAIFTFIDGSELDQTLQVSGRILGITITDNPSSEGTLIYAVVGERTNEETGECDEPYDVPFVTSAEGTDFKIISITEL